MFDCMVVVLTVIEYTTDVEYGYGAIVEVSFFVVAAAVVLKKQQVVIESFETLGGEFSAFCTEFAYKQQEFKVAVDGKVFTVGHNVLAMNMALAFLRNGV